MKYRRFISLIPLIVLLNGCTFSSGDSAKKNLIEACKLVNDRSPAPDIFIPNEAVEFFASAARENPEYIRLVEAAKLSQFPPFGYSQLSTLSSDIIKARALISGYCLPKNE